MLAILFGLSLLFTLSVAQMEFDLTAVVASLAPQKRGVAKRQAAPTPCGGHDTYPPTVICTPARIADTSDSQAPGAGKRAWVVGERGIANGVCNTRKAQGALVTCTNTEKNPNRRAQLGLAPMEPLASGIELIELDYGKDGEPSLKAPERVVNRWMRANGGYLPDEIYLVGNNANSGNPEDYSLEDRLYNERVHNTGWHTLLIEFLKYRKFPQNANRTISVTFMISAGAYAVTPGVLDGWYYPGHKKKADYTRHMNVKQLAKNSTSAPQNWRFRTLAGFFVNTTYYQWTQNPSAALGDTAQQQYLAFTKAMTLAIGNSVQEAANALIRIATQPLGGANHFLLLPKQLPAPAPYTDWSSGSFRTLENNFEDPLYTQAALGGMAQLQILMNQHGAYELPAYAYGSNDW